MKAQKTQVGKKTIQAVVTDYGKAVHVNAPGLNMLVKSAFYHEVAKSNPKFFLRQNVLLAIPLEARLQVVHPKRLIWYMDGAKYEYKGPWEDKVTIESIKSWDRVLCDQTCIDGYMYTVDGKPIPRSYYLDYIYTEFRTPKWTANQLHEIQKALEKMPRVKRPEIVEIPYGMRVEDDPERKTITYGYAPDEKEFKRIHEADMSENWTKRWHNVVNEIVKMRLPAKLRKPKGNPAWNK